MQLPFYRDIEQVRDEARGCLACGRSAHRSQVVFGAGNTSARLMLVAEYPSQSDDRTGLPFTGPGGEYLDELLELAGTHRDEIYITNLVRCYATESGKPGGKIKGASRREIDACSVWMNLETQFVDPHVILAIGAPAAAEFFDRDFQLSEHRGSWRQRPDGRWISATLQPAYVLRLRTHDPERADELHHLVLNDIRAAVERSRLTPPG
jgi:uracil-DNA glycosylase